MITENLPADWAITKALELMRSRSALAFVKRCPARYPDTIRVARYIEQHEKPPIDPLLIEAREVVAQRYVRDGRPIIAADYRDGHRDDYYDMQITLAALRRGIEIAGERA